MPAVAHRAVDAKRSTRLAALRDGLARRPPELPARYWWTSSDRALREKVHALPEPRLGEVERALFASMPSQRVRAVVHLLPDVCGATREALAPLIDTDGAPRYIRLEQPLEIAPDLPLPANTERPRLIVCQGNAVGVTHTVGTIRLLRASRAAMRGEDRLLLGVDLRTDAAELERAHDDAGGVLGAYALSTLTTVNRELGTDFDITCFRHRVRYVPEHRRVEAMLVVTRAHDVTIDGSPRSFRKGESVLITVNTSFTRGTLEGMLAAVGLEILEWRADAGQRFAVVTAGVATRDRV
jgi:uncharacterized SAM-dependent methyltransferase